MFLFANLGPFHRSSFLSVPLGVESQDRLCVSKSCFQYVSPNLFKCVFLTWGCPGDSDGKESACNAGFLGLIPGWEDPLEKETATYSSILAWRIPWTEEPDKLIVHGVEMDMTEQLSLFTVPDIRLHCIHAYICTMFILHTHTHTHTHTYIHTHTYCVHSLKS